MSDPIQIDQAGQPQEKKHGPGSNHAQQEISRLRATAESEQESPTERLRAAASLLSRFGPTKRNYAVIQRTIKLFINSRDNDIAERAKKLKKKLLKGVDLNAVVSAEFPDEIESQVVKPAAENVFDRPASGLSASNLSLSWASLIEAHEKAMSNVKIRWQSNDFSTTEREKLLKAVLGDCAITVDNVRSLIEALRKKDSQGFDLSGFPIFRVALDWLAESGSPTELQARKESERQYRENLLALLS